jgi:hypothetical protein
LKGASGTLIPLSLFLPPFLDCVAELIDGEMAHEFVAFSRVIARPRTDLLQIADHSDHCKLAPERLEIGLRSLPATMS